MDSSFLLIGTVACTLCLLIAFMFLTSQAHYGLKVALTVVLVAGSIFTWRIANGLLGVPTYGMPPSDSVIVAFVNDKRHDFIAMWIRQRPRPRAYTVPYDAKLAALLAAGEKAAREQGGGELILRYGMLGGQDGYVIDDTGRSVRIDVPRAMPNKRMN